MAATRRLQRLLDHQRPAQPHPDAAATPTAAGHLQQPKRDWCAVPFRTVVALGESTTAGGWSTSPERCWVSQLGKLLNDFLPCDVINSGIGANLVSSSSPNYEQSGKPAADIRLQKHVIDHRPDLVLLSYGLNDARGGTTVPHFIASLRSLITRLRESPSPPLVLLMGPYHMTAEGFAGHGDTWAHADLSTFHAFNDATAALAAEEDCLFADVLNANGGTDWMVHFDGVHANDVGHAIAAQEVFRTLAQNCSCIAAATQEAEKTSPRWRDEDFEDLSDPDLVIGSNALQASDEAVPRLRPDSEGKAWLDGIDTFVCDLDGVVWRGETVIDGAPEAVAALRGAGKRVLFLTNNASKSRETYVKKLAGFGISVELKDVITSAYAAASHMVSQGLADKKAFVIGGLGLFEELRAVGVETLGDDGTTDTAMRKGHAALGAEGFSFAGLDQEVAAVVMGWDGEIDFYKIAHATGHITNGAAFIATNPDVTSPASLVSGGSGAVDNTFIPANGALVAAVAAAAGREPDVVVGKPNPDLAGIVLAQNGLDPARTCMVGDRVDTDVAFGVASGMQTLLVETGSHTAADAAALEAGQRPGRVLAGLAGLSGLVEGA